MNVLRRICVALLAAFLPFLLYLTALDFGVVRIAGNPAKVKKIIADSGVYQNIIPATLDQAAKNGGGNGGGVSLADPAVKDAAAKVLTPQFLQQSTDSIISGIYDWLGGQAAQPDFRVDLTAQKTQFAAQVAAEAKHRAAKLPRCSVVQGPRSSDFDVFSAKCLPRNVTPASAAAEVRKNLLGGDFLKNPVITASTLKTGKSEQSVFEGKSLKNAPQYYRLAKKTPFILSLLTLLVIAGIVFISSRRLKGLRRVGAILAGTGLVMLVFAWAFNYGVTQKVLPHMNGISNPAIQADVKRLATDITQAIDRNYWIFGGLYVILGGAAIIGAAMIKRKQRRAIEADAPKPAVKPKTGLATADIDQRA